MAHPATFPWKRRGNPWHGNWQTLVLLLAVWTPAAAMHRGPPWEFEGLASPPQPPPLPPLPPLPSTPPPPYSPSSFPWEMFLSIALPMVGGFFLIFGTIFCYSKLCAIRPRRSAWNWICFAGTTAMSWRPGGGGVDSTAVSPSQDPELAARAIVVGTKVDGSAMVELGSFAEVAMISGRVVGVGPFTSALPTLP